MHTRGPYQAANVIAAVSATAINVQIEDDAAMAKQLAAGDGCTIHQERVLVFLLVRGILVDGCRRSCSCVVSSPALV